MHIVFKVIRLAEMVELVDTQVSGTCGSNPVEVRVLSSALKFKPFPSHYFQTDVATQSYRYDQLPLK
jgi:hypothetical protein